VWGVKLELVTSPEEADVCYSQDGRGLAASHVEIDLQFYRAIAELRDLAGDWSSGPAGATLCPEQRDPVAVAFFHLARVEEYISPAVDHWWRFSPEASSLLSDGGLLERPVDRCFDRIHRVASQSRSERGLPPPIKRPLFAETAFTVALTHDVDALRFVSPLQAMGVPYRLIRGRASLRETGAAANFLLTGRIGRRDPFARLDGICEIEREMGARSTFFFMPEHRYRLDGRDGRYYSRALRDAVTTVIDHGAEIGLHATTQAVLSARALAGQRLHLQEVAGVSVEGVRYHNLLLRVPDTLEHLEQAGLRFDSTMGYAALHGFRSGTAWPHRLYSLKRDRSLDVIEVPLVAMDTTFASKRYQGLLPDRALPAIQAALGGIAESGGAASLLWHNSAFDDRLTSGYGSLYQELLRWTYDHGGIGRSVGDVAQAFSDRLAITCNKVIP
jgi:hypothetical protein